MSQTTSAEIADSAKMEDDAPVTEQKQQEPPSSTAASASADPQPPPPLAVPAGSARAQRVSRRAQMRGDEPEPDPAELERKRSETLQSKASARAAAQEARRAAALAAQTALWRSFGPAQKLFADGIAMCIGFLDLKDVLAAARTCKSWREGAKTIRSLGSAEVRDAMVRGLIPPMLASPFRHLVSALTDELTWRELERGARITIQSTARFDWTRQRLGSLLQLSGLTSLTLCIDITKITGMAPIVYPPRLQHLTLSIGCYRKGPGYMWSCAPFLRGLSSCLSLRGLTLRFLDRNEMYLDPSVLVALPEFREFALELLGFTSISPDLLHVITQLPRLQSLSFVNFNDHVIAQEDEDLDFIIPLLQEPNPLPQLTRLNVSPCSWTKNEIELSRLPSLTELKPDTVSLDVLPQLASLPRLTCLHLPFEYGRDFYEDRDDFADIMDEHERIRATAVLPHLQSLTALTELLLKGVAFTKDDFATLCNVHHGLQILRLDQVAVASLEGLDRLVALRELELSLAEHAEVVDVAQHIVQCKSLEKLELSKMSPALSEATQLALKPPSVLLPLLKSFDYSARCADRAHSHRSPAIGAASNQSQL